MEWFKDMVVEKGLQKQVNRALRAVSIAYSVADNPVDGTYLLAKVVELLDLEGVNLTNDERADFFMGTIGACIVTSEDYYKFVIKEMEREEDAVDLLELAIANMVAMNVGENYSLITMPLPQAPKASSFKTYDDFLNFLV